MVFNQDHDRDDFFSIRVWLIRITISIGIMIAIENIFQDLISIRKSRIDFSGTVFDRDRDRDYNFKIADRF